MFLVFALLVSTLSLSGSVEDQNGEPIPGVTVQSARLQIATITDYKGSFSIEIPDSVSTLELQFRHIAYKNRKVQFSIDSWQTSMPVILKENTLRSEDIVVTATRTAKQIEEIPTPIKVIGKDQIEKSAVFRLDQVLLEQAGLTLVPDHGAGLQLQGFDPEYTLVLVDGEPIIGRTAGTLDLSRISLGNIERIEMVKGPSSALWGSEALAGVVNIITARPENSWTISGNGRGGTNNTFDTSVRADFSSERLEQSMFFNRNTSSGFDLSETVPGPTAPPFENLTLQGKTRLKLGDQGFASVAGRYYDESSNMLSRISGSEGDFLINDAQNVTDWNINPVVGYQFPNLRLEARYYAMQYNFDSEVTYSESGEIFDASVFAQTYQKAETQADWVAAPNQLVTFGGGYINEQVDATRYRDNPVFQSVFSYLQHDWTISDRWSMITGVRSDIHSEYGSQISPKLSARFEQSEQLSLKISAGRGFKAPDFRQLLLNFINPQAGYAVFGTREIVSEIQQMQQRGEIARILIDPSRVAELDAENSWAINFGIDVNPAPEFSLSANVFHNNVRDLIDTQPVAQRTNNSNVFSYVNLNHVILQGIEVEASWRPHPDFRVQLGYQYLDSRDVDQVRRLREGNVFRTISGASGRVERVPVSNYGGLVNRSRHMGNLMLFYRWKPTDIDVALRAQFRGRFGFGDLNQNGIIDTDSEYAPGYQLWNLTLSRNLGETLRVFASAENMFNHTEPLTQPFIPGRMIFFGINLNLKNTKQ